MVVSVLGRNRTTSGSWVVYRRVGFAVQMAWYGAGLRVLGSTMEWLCSVVLGCGWLLQMAWYGVGLRVLGSAMEWLCFVVLGCRFWVRWWSGCALWCWVAGGCCGWRDMVLSCRCWVRRWRLERQRWGSAMEIGETEMRDERQRRESEIKYYYFFTIFATMQFYV